MTFLDKQVDLEVYMENNAEAREWAMGYGVIRHSEETQRRIFALSDWLQEVGMCDAGCSFFRSLKALDRVTSAGLWLVVHQTYALRCSPAEGAPLVADDFKTHPEGHTGGSLNMVPAYAGYMAANAITGETRAWVMGQGHAVAAVESVNLILGNMSETQSARYNLSGKGISSFLSDFYSLKVGADCEQEAPLGSHVNAYTGGGVAEGGYLGVVELEYVHMPLPGEKLVVFLSDGAFEEQRGSDWTPRWWRPEDSGLVAPIMINNGRRIDQCTTMSMQGGVDWFMQHLKLNSFDPFTIDGRDPAAFVWAILEMELRLRAAGEDVRGGREPAPVRLPYCIAVAPKGAGFHNEGTVLAHNLPLMTNPRHDADAARLFNEHAARLRVPFNELEAAAATLLNHAASGRPREKDHYLVHRKVGLPHLPELRSQPVPGKREQPEWWTRASPMEAIDETFMDIVRANPGLRPRVGNPDEMRSNRMIRTLEELKFRVTNPSTEVPESTTGAVITVLNEEAVAAAATGNKGGISIVVTYEAFAAKMHGVIRQEITFTDQCRHAGRPIGWLSIPVVLTSHTWENGKNEHSHQDPVLAEAMMCERAPSSRALFIPDFNTAAVALREVYQTRGTVCALVVPKMAAPNLFKPDEAAQLYANGAMRLEWAGHRPEDSELVLTAVGSYQLLEVIRASRRLGEANLAHSVVYMIEPGRFREARSRMERDYVAPARLANVLYPHRASARVFVTHTRPEPLLGTLARLSTGPERTRVLGFINHGGTLGVNGMLFVNHCSWLHILAECANVLGMPPEHLLNPSEVDVITCKTAPDQDTLRAA